MQFSTRVSRLRASPIREILKVIDKPGMISFAGGLPAADSFPDLSVNGLNHKQLQYGATEGELELREHIAADLAKRGMKVSAAQVLVLSGSQQGIDLVSKLMIDEATPVAIESPTYLAALQVFTLFGADTIAYTPNTIEQLRSGVTGDGRSPSLTYTIPTFQNPTGHCYTLEQRQALAQVCDDNGSVLFEDDPYRALAYDECERRPVCSFIKKAHWIYQSSFSKTLAPGLRLGYLVCSPDLYPALCWLKQAADLHSNRLSQYIVFSQLTDACAQQREASLVDSYRSKRDLFADALTRHLHNHASWEVPKGGLFFWLTLKTETRIDSRELLVEALKHNVAFMPGEPFFPDNKDTPVCIRLNFSHASEDQVEAGLRKISEILSAAMV